MKMRLAKFLVIAAALFVLNGTTPPTVDAQSNNCRCYGTSYTAAPFLVPNPICGEHNFDLWSNRVNQAACTSWCNSTVDFLTHGSCSTDTCPGWNDNPPISYGWDGFAYFYGPPTTYQNVHNPAPLPSC